APVPSDTGAPPGSGPMPPGAWQMDQGRQPPVAWSPGSDASRYDARTDVYSISAAKPANGRPGSPMSGGTGHGIICSACGAENADNARFCSQCATPVTRQARGGLGGSSPPRASTDRGSFGETTSMIFTGVEPAESEPFDQSAAD